MELKYLQTFRTVVETGSFSKAADHLNYTQSAITFQMGQLERELGVPLFEKMGRSMTLTQAGTLLVPYVDNVLDSLEKLRSFENELSACRGTLRVGVGETLLCYRMGPVLKAFHQAAPQAQLHLRSMNCYDIRNELLEGRAVEETEVLAALDRLEPQDIERLAARLLQNAPWALAVAGKVEDREAYLPYIRP